ncbi:hypothetical protein BN8_01607 [Fibrisoma limi BUZ 3]|uniref:Uncharacterized protein n=1 Tax=Fibrisoma limi BUZ 3 TaxID=1185876 RepID=I2GFC0_9BACT|nr:hypothetical protein [Fibrisoma limi]CCH52595.1 hypothetical protein BN8_01607 [Fibrisoma limi BUZ 3]
MKTTLFIIALISLTVSTALAQDDRKLRSDGTYSVHNYKHPNKAATARKWSSQVSVPVSTPATVAGPVANYKQSVPGQVPAGGVTVPHTPLEDVALRNYKIQRVNHGRPATQKDTGVMADKPQTQSITEGN